MLAGRSVIHALPGPREDAGYRVEVRRYAFVPDIGKQQRSAQHFAGQVRDIFDALR
jgi:hypothetical protein